MTYEVTVSHPFGTNTFTVDAKGFAEAKQKASDQMRQSVTRFSILAVRKVGQGHTQ